MHKKLESCAWTKEFTIIRLSTRQIHATLRSGPMTMKAQPTTRTRSFTKSRALDAAEEILIVGPCATKAEFVKYMHKNDHAIDPRILGVETVAHLNDPALAGFAKLYFTVGGPRRDGNGSGYRVPD